jgi:hypothetical protein
MAGPRHAPGCLCVQPITSVVARRRPVSSRVTCEMLAVRLLSARTVKEKVVSDASRGLGRQSCDSPWWASAHGLSSNEGCHRHQSPSGRAARSSISASSRMCRRTRMSSPCRRSSNTARRLSSGNSAMSPAEGPQLGSGAASSPTAVARFALPRGRRRYQSPISAQAHGGINVNVATTAVVSLREYAAASATALSSMWTTASAIPASVALFVPSAVCAVDGERRRIPRRSRRQR